MRDKLQKDPAHSKNLDQRTICTEKWKTKVVVSGACYKSQESC